MVSKDEIRVRVKGVKKVREYTDQSDGRRYKWVQKGPRPQDGSYVPVKQDWDRNEIRSRLNQLVDEVSPGQLRQYENGTVPPVLKEAIIRRLGLR